MKNTFFAAVITTVMTALLFASPAAIIPPAHAQADMTRDEIGKLGIDELQQIPALSLMRFLSDQAPREDINAIFQVGLRELGFYHGLPNGRMDRQMKKAVHAFRAALGEEKSDILTVGNASELARRLSLFEPDHFWIPRSLLWDYGPNKKKGKIRFSGSWRDASGQSDPSGYFTVHDYSIMTCSLSTKRCTERALLIERPGLHRYELRLGETEWTITQLSDEKLSATGRVIEPDRGERAPCEALSLTVDFKAHKATRRLDYLQNKGCVTEKWKKPSDSYELISAPDRLMPGWKDDLAARRAALSPDYRALVERLHKSSAWGAFEMMTTTELQ